MTGVRLSATWMGSIAAQWQAALPVRQAAFVAACSCVVFVAVNWRNYAVDVVPQSLLPVVIWHDGTICLDRYRAEYESMRVRGQEHAFKDVDGHLYPRNSVYVALLALPIYLPPLLAGVPPDAMRFWIAWSGLTAAVWTSIALGFAYLTLRRFGTPLAAAGLAFLFAFGTGLWTTVAHGIYDHLGVWTSLMVVVWLLDDFPLSTRRASAVAFLIGLTVAMRPSTVILLVPLAGFLFFARGVLTDGKGRVAAVIAVCIVPVSNALVNEKVYGRWYHTGYPTNLVTDWGNPFWEGFFGLLIAPNAGLLSQSPFLMLAAIGAWRVWRPTDDCRSGLLRAFSLCFVAYWVLFSFRHEWEAGLTFSARFLMDTFPVLLPLTMLGWNRIRDDRRWQLLFIGAGVWSVMYQVINIATFDAVTDFNPRQQPWQPSRHYVGVFLAHYGITALIAAVLQTITLFCIALGVACFALRSIVFSTASAGTKAD